LSTIPPTQLQTGQSAKVKQSFPENLIKKNISALKFFCKSTGTILFYRLIIKPAAG